MNSVVIEMADSAPMFVRSGWAKVFRAIGWNATEWWPNNTPAFDVFNAEKPDLFIGTTYNINRALDKIIRQNPAMKVALFASAHGDLTDSVDSNKYPIVKISESEKSIIGALKDQVNKPDLVFIHITERHLEGSLGKWKSEFDIPIMGLLNGADLFQYYGVKPQPRYKSDVSYVGGRWGYKAQTLDAYIGALCDDNTHNWDIKIFGNNWDKPQFLGSIGLGEDAAVFSSAKINISISEAHSYILDDLVERIFKVPAANGFLICDQVNLDEVGLTKIVPQFSSYKEMRDIIQYFLNIHNDYERLILTNKARSIILENHSYFERVYKLLNNLNLPIEASKVLAKKQEIFGLDSIYSKK